MPGYAGWRVDQSPAVGLTTFRDLVDHTLDYFGADSSQQSKRVAVRCVQSAYRTMANKHQWSYYWVRGRLNTVASQTTGTIAYDHTGGTYERQVTLTGATWPAWADLGVLRISNIDYQVAERKSDTVITLTIQANPGADVASGTDYTIYRDTYQLPNDFNSAGILIQSENIRMMEYLSPSQWLEVQQRRYGPATPWRYTFMGDENYHGAMALKVWPPPDNIYAFDFLYKRRPRALKILDYSTGKASITATGTTVTGTGGTAFTSSMVGSVFRISDAGETELPTSPDGPNYAAQERIITAVSSGTSLTVDVAFDQTIATAPYMISDPVDIEPGVMTDYLLRECEKQARQLRRQKTLEHEEKYYTEALFEAMENDARTFEKRIASLGTWVPIGLDDYPNN